MQDHPRQLAIRRRALACAWLAACFAVIYLGDIGSGFVKDDFSWILHSRIRSSAELWRVLAEAPLGFYRPVVGLSFSLNYILFDLAPLGYALTNLGLVIGISVVLALLVKRLGLDHDAAIVAAGLWLFNVHGINMSLMWISGRTSLLATFWASVAALAFTGRRFKLTGLLALLALMSKEEPLLLPLVFTFWALVDATRAPSMWRPRTIVAATWPSFAALGLYLIIRSSTAAFTPASAPSFYRLTADPMVILQNVASYLDRSLTFGTAIVILTAAVRGHTRFNLLDTERTTFLKGLAWLVCGFGVTVMLPVRSSLYVCLPAIGSALMGSALIAALWRTSALRKRRALAFLWLCIPLALLPIYRARNARLKAEAMLSRQVIEGLMKAPDGERTSAHVILHDKADRRPSFRDAFASSLPDAIRLVLGSDATGEIVPFGGASTAAAASGKMVIFELGENGHVLQR